MIVCSFVHNGGYFFLLIIIMFCILVSYIINVFIFRFIYFYTGPILIAAFITEMVILFKHVIIIIIIIIALKPLPPFLFQAQLASRG